MIEYKQRLVNYIVCGEGEEALLYLHGWGGSIDRFKYLALTMPYKNILIDFPPFGQSQEPLSP